MSNRKSRRYEAAMRRKGKNPNRVAAFKGTNKVKGGYESKVAVVPESLFLPKLKDRDWWK